MVGRGYYSSVELIGHGVTTDVSERAGENRPDTLAGVYSYGTKGVSGFGEPGSFAPTTMTYKGSNWTRGELGPAIDRDPMIPCIQCDEEHRYIGYWQPRYIDGKDWIPREVAWICDECLEQAKSEHELHQKRQQNAAITEWA